VVSYMEAGLVCVPEDAPFTHDFIVECEAFTADDTHAYDDQIDPMVDAIDKILSNKNTLKQWENLI
jgi:predicted phage terminase large subunit-like protein